MTTVDEFKDAYLKYKEAVKSKNVFVESSEYDEDNDGSLEDNIIINENITFMKELLEENENGIIKYYKHNESMLMFIENLKEAL